MTTYIIESQGVYKIGKTTNIQKRLDGYDTHNPGYELIHTYSADCEAYLHSMFSSKRIRKEWFSLDSIDIQRAREYHPAAILPVKSVKINSVSGYTGSIDVPNLECSISMETMRLMYSMKGPEIKVYAYLLANYNFDTTIAIVKGIKKEMVDKMGGSTRTIDNALVTLTQKKLIYTTGRAMYKLNPRYAFKGSTGDRNRLLKVILEMECPDC